MPIFTDAQMQVFADLLEELGMIDQATIERPVAGADPLVIAENTPCLVNPPQQSQATYEDFRGNVVEWPILFPLNSDITEGDILTIKGQVMTVQLKKSPRSFAVYDEVIATGVRG